MAEKLPNLYKDADYIWVDFQLDAVGVNALIEKFTLPT